MTGSVYGRGHVTAVLIGWFFAGWIFSAGTCWAEVSRVASSAPEAKVWRGQRATFFVELRANGSFVGASGFSLPEIPRTVIVKVGNPVVSSKEIEDESWFIQTHEFSLFSQATGSVEIPPFEVRFSHRDGFTGPATDQVEQVPGLQFQVESPAGSEEFGFLVTTDQMEVTESWDPRPSEARADDREARADDREARADDREAQGGDKEARPSAVEAKLGDVFRRTITQQADQMTGMALAPPSTSAPEGIRVYTGSPEVTDRIERGDFNGTRRDTITYLLQQPGNWTIPAVQYVWFNPTTKELESKTLPPVTFDVAAPPAPPPQEEATSPLAFLNVSLIAFVVGGLAIWQRHRMGRGIGLVANWLNPPHRVAERKLLQACRRDDAEAAEAAWLQWQNLQPPQWRASASLRTAVVELQRHLFGPATNDRWNGESLRLAFHEQLKTDGKRAATAHGPLPELNPH
jgi:hypothetical protein